MIYLMCRPFLSAGRSTSISIDLCTDASNSVNYALATPRSSDLAFYSDTRQVMTAVLNLDTVRFQDSIYVHFFISIVHNITMQKCSLATYGVIVLYYVSQCTILILRRM